MADQPPPQAMPAGHGLAIMFGKTLVVVGEVGSEHAKFFAQVQVWKQKHVEMGSPRSGYY
jgi:hypothetical protein